jgi:hypothetical protein
MERIRTYRMRSSSKYGNRKCRIDGFTFDSMKEGRRYAELKILLREGLIKDLELQKQFELQPGFIDADGKRIRPIYYRADFCYTDTETGKMVVEDVKSSATKTAVYKLKRKMMAYKGIKIKEIE